VVRPFTKLYEWDRPVCEVVISAEADVAWNCLDKHVERAAATRLPTTGKANRRDDRRELTYTDCWAR